MKKGVAWREEGGRGGKEHGALTAGILQAESLPGGKSDGKINH
jgi:hypothetical protein